DARSVGLERVGGERAREGISARAQALQPHAPPGRHGACAEARRGARGLPGRGQARLGAVQGVPASGRPLMAAGVFAEALRKGLAACEAQDVVRKEVKQVLRLAADDITKALGVETSLVY